MQRQIEFIVVHKTLFIKTHTVLILFGVKKSELQLTVLYVHRVLQ